MYYSLNLAHQILGHCSPTPGLSEKAEKVDQSSPISRKSGSKSKIWPQKSRPPRSLGGEFWHEHI